MPAFGKCRCQGRGRREEAAFILHSLLLLWFWKLCVENAGNHLTRQQPEPPERTGSAGWSDLLVIEFHDCQQSVLSCQHCLQFLLSLFSGVHHCEQFEGQRQDVGLIEVEICKPFGGIGYSTV